MSSLLSISATIIIVSLDATWTLPNFVPVLL